MTRRISAAAEEDKNMNPSNLKWRKWRYREIPVQGYTVRSAMFGPRHRYSVHEFLARDLGEGRQITYIVSDAEIGMWSDCLSSVIRQSATLEEALQGIPERGEADDF
jgi:hypothetical protein